MRHHHRFWSCRDRQQPLEGAQSREGYLEKSRSERPGARRKDSHLREAARVPETSGRAQNRDRVIHANVVDPAPSKTNLLNRHLASGHNLASIYPQKVQHLQPPQIFAQGGRSQEPLPGLLLPRAGYLLRQGGGHRPGRALGLPRADPSRREEDRLQAIFCFVSLVLFR